MPRSLSCLCAVALATGALAQGAAAGGSGVVLNVTAQVVAACSVTASADEGGRSVGHDCTLAVPHRVSVDPLDASSTGLAAESTDGWRTAESDGADGALIVTVTY